MLNLTRILGSCWIFPHDRSRSLLPHRPGIERKIQPLEKKQRGRIGARAEPLYRREGMKKAAHKPAAYSYATREGYQ